MKYTHTLTLALAMLLAAPMAAGQDLGSLKGLAGGSSATSMVSGSVGNAAGILEFCIKNNYLNADAATAMKDKLLAKSGLNAPGNDDEGDYDQGAMGILSSPDGKSIDLAATGDRLKEKATKAACDRVLAHADSLL